MTSYYNEIDKPAAAWLRELIKAGHIADGIVDERDIQDVLPSDLAGFTQCHFFAGIGGWSYALRKSGWPDDRPVWTGSCPCQPFSAAGKGTAFADDRHLWPSFHHLIKKHRPVVVFGEQVASKDADAWIDLVQDDLEALGYAVGAVPFPAASVGAPHIRDRLYWVADSERFGHAQIQRQSGVGFLGGRVSQRPRAGFEPSHTDSRPGPTNGFWRDADWIGCRDGKWRPVEPGTFPLADGIPARVVRLRGYGNAINAVQAQAFVEAFMDYQQVSA